MRFVSAHRHADFQREFAKNPLPRARHVRYSTRTRCPTSTSRTDPDRARSGAQRRAAGAGRLPLAARGRTQTELRGPGHPLRSRERAAHPAAARASARPRFRSSARNKAASAGRAADLVRATRSTGRSTSPTGIRSSRSASGSCSGGAAAARRRGRAGAAIGVARVRRRWRVSQRRRPVGSAPTATLRDALVATGFSPVMRRHGLPEDNMPRSAARQPEVRDIRRCGSAALDLCLVADGTYDAYWERACRAGTSRRAPRSCWPPAAS